MPNTSSPSSAVVANRNSLKKPTFGGPSALPFSTSTELLSSSVEGSMVSLEDGLALLLAHRRARGRTTGADRSEGSFSRSEATISAGAGEASILGCPENVGVGGVELRVG